MARRHGCSESGPAHVSDDESHAKNYIEPGIGALRLESPSRPRRPGVAQSPDRTVVGVMAGLSVTSSTDDRSSQGAGGERYRKTDHLADPRDRVEGLDI